MHRILLGAWLEVLNTYKYIHAHFVITRKCCIISVLCISFAYISIYQTDGTRMNLIKTVP